MALNAGRSIKLDERGFVIDVWDSNNNHYDPMTGERITPSARLEEVVVNASSTDSPRASKTTSTTPLA